MIMTKKGRSSSPHALPDIQPLRSFTINISYPQWSRWAFCSSLSPFAASCWVGASIARVEAAMTQERPQFGGHHSTTYRKVSYFFFFCFLGRIRPINFLLFIGRSANGLNSRPPSRTLSGATSDGSLNRRPSKRKPAPAPHIHANLAPNASSPTSPYQSPVQTPGTYTPMKQFNSNMNGGVAPTQSHGFQPIQQTQPQHQVAMSVIPSRLGGYYGQQDPRMSAFSSATSNTDTTTTQVGSGKTSPGAAGVGSGYGGGGSYFGATHAQQQAHPQNNVLSPHSYSQQQPQPQVYSQSQPPPRSIEYTQPQPQASQNEQGPNDNKYGTYSIAEAYDGVADSPSGKAPLKADSAPPVAGSSSNIPAHPPPNYAKGD
jgi:hypothetical protein